MTFSSWSSYRIGTYCYDEYLAIQYVLNKLEGRITVFRYYKGMAFFINKAIYIIQLDKTMA